MKEIEKHKSFGGTQYVFEHESLETNCNMRFGIFLPPQANLSKVPVLYWLSGLTCTEQNFINKAGAQRIAAELGLAIVVPDTSPRDEAVADDDAYDLGKGAGFYVDATQDPWSKHYRMASYIQKELPHLIQKEYPNLDHGRCGIFGHSMGGHGALTLALKHPQQYRSVSAFAPICAPTQTFWGRKAFAAYLGEDESAWQQYDACQLMAAHPWPNGEILIDQGMGDEFLEHQLCPELFEQACQSLSVTLRLRMQPDYDHSYYFIASFVEEHLKFHIDKLK